MGGRAAKVCAKPECPHIQPCPDHPAEAWAGSDRASRLPSDWAKRRRRVLARQPICNVCHSSPSSEVDHIIAGDNHRLTNLQGICSHCHKAKTSAEAAEARRLNS